MLRVVKIIVTGGLLIVLARAVEWDELREHVGQLQWWAICIGIAAYALQFFISGWKWLCALRVLGADLPLLFLVRVYCIGHFVGQFLPSAIGGDAYRIFRTVPLVEPRSRAVSAVIVDRLTGFATLLLLGAIGALTVGRRPTLDHIGERAVV